MSLITRVNRLAALRNIISAAQSNIRCISTSPKKRDTATIITTEKSTETVSQTAEKNKNWVYWGFVSTDQASDHDAMKASFFFSITLCIVIGGFVFYYQPDFLCRDWAQREGYLELRRREAAGVDLVNPNYIDPALIPLPSDEELGNTEIII